MQEAEIVVRLDHIKKTFPIASGYISWLRYRGAPPRRPALIDASFAVARGELFGLLGENGTGKSTILRLLAGLVTPDSGRISIAGIDIGKRSRRARALVGLCTGEERSFYFRLTARQNLEYFGRLAGVNHASMQARISEVARHVDLEHDLDRRFDGYSAGMRQRLAIARALMADAEILLLDEPTRAVDPIHAQGLRALIRDELIGRLGKTIILATNALDEAWELCDRVAVLRAGHVAAVASPAELSDSACRSQIYHIEVDRADDALFARIDAVGGLVSATSTARATGISLRVAIDDNPRTLTNVLRAVSANGIAVRSIRPDSSRLVDVFAMLAK
jgi:ABC-2 type transport system ATP-binding protein